MKRNFLKFITGCALCAALSAVPMSANAATPEEAAALARSMGLPESIIQAGWNKYYENPEMYPPELIDSYMATLRGMNQDMINQLLIDNGFAPSTPTTTAAPAVTTLTQDKTTSVTTTEAVNSSEADGNSDNNSNGNGSAGKTDKTDSDKITLTLPDGSTFDRISSKEFSAMTLDEKRKYIASLSPEQKTAFLENMSPEDYKSLLKQLPLDNKAEILDSMADITSKLGLTLSVDELKDDNIVLSVKDEDGKLVALSAVSDTVAATGYDKRGILALAAVISALGISAAAVTVKKSFGKNEV